MTHSQSDSPVPNWWDPKPVPAAPAGYGAMIEAVRELLDAVAEAVPDEALVAATTERLRATTEALRPAAEPDEWRRLAGRLDDIRGRGQALIPPLDVKESDDHQVTGTVHFGSYYLGGNGAVHGGALPLLFDDLLGRFANSGGRPVARTAYLHVDYRSVTPVGRDLTLRMTIEREEGRKRYVRGTISDGDRLCAEAEGLFVALRPGQA